MFGIFDTYPPPNVPCFSCKLKDAIQHLQLSLGALGQDLVGVPVRFHHDASDAFNIVVRNVFVEKVAHRVHEDHAGRSPREWLEELFGDEP